MKMQHQRKLNSQEEYDVLQFNVDKDLCIQCGECAADCPYLIIEMEDGYPVINEERAGQCIECQHCFAVCKPGALSIFGLDPQASTPLKGNMPTPESVSTLLMGRRSVRRYKEEPVDSGLLDSIMDTVRSAPTGVNNRSTLYTLVEDQQTMAILKEKTYAALKTVVDNKALPQGLEFFEGISKAYEKGVDVLFRGAPHFLVASAPKNGPSPKADTLIGLTCFELLANSYGLGVVWDGLAKWALLDIAPEAGDLLGIPDDHTVGYMLAFGLPAVKYHRTVQRPGGTVNKLCLK